MPSILDTRIDGARVLIKKFGLKIVYDKSYPPSTVDYTPIARAIKAVNPDIVFVASYPPDSVGMVRAAHEIGLQPKIFGGGMVGPQFTTVMTSLGPMLNGIVNYDFWAPETTMMFPGIKEFFAEYQKRAEEAGVDPLGYYLPPYAYSVGPDPRPGHRGHQEPRPAEGGRLHPGQRVQHHRRQGALRPERGVGQVRVLQVQYQGVKGERRRAVPRARQEDRALSRRVQVGHHGLPLLRGHEIAAAQPAGGRVASPAGARALAVP